MISEDQINEVCPVCGGRALTCSRMGHRPESDRNIKWRDEEPSRPVEPSATGRDENHENLASNLVANAKLAFDRNIFDHTLLSWAQNTIQNQDAEIDALRKQNASLQSRLDVMQQDRDDWRARAEHFVKLASEAAKAMDVMRPFQVKGED